MESNVGSPTQTHAIAPRTERALLWAVVAVGSVFVVVAAAHFVPRWDGITYVDLGRSVARGNGFVDGDGALDHHYAPMWPFVIALFAGHAALAEIVSIGGLWVVVYGGARLIWGSMVALRALALTSITSGFLPAVRYGFSEPLVASIYVALVYASIYTLRRPALMPIAGVLAGFLYLSKSSLGYALLAGAVAGGAWRVALDGKRILRGEYVTAGLLAMVIAGVWIVRNVIHFGPAGWETQPYADQSLATLFASPDAGSRLAAAFAAVVAVLVMYGGSGLVTLLGRWPKLAHGELSGLTLGALTPALTAAPMVAAFGLVEGQTVWSNMDVAGRYALIGLPALWAVYAHDRRATWAAIATNLVFTFATK